MKKLLLITPPFLQVNSPYPATPYLAGYLRGKGHRVEQVDLGIDLINEIFSADFLREMFEKYSAQYGFPNGSTVSDDENTDISKGESVDVSEVDVSGVDVSGRADVLGGMDVESLLRTYRLRRSYISTVDTVMAFLRGEDTALANLICMPDFLPQGARFAACTDLEVAFGTLGTVDCAKYLATLYLQDVSDYIRGCVTANFEIVRYGERLALSVPEFGQLQQELDKPLNMIEQRMIERLAKYVDEKKPDFIGFTVPFPGNLLSSLRCAQFLKQNYPDVRTIMGGGYPTTELRQMSDRTVFKYFDYVVLDDGELPLERILTGGELLHTYTKQGYFDGDSRISHEQRGCPDYEGMPLEKYFSLCEVTNPMHRLWSDGRWNKMTLAHGCYWAKCAFCDTSLDYIKCYDTAPASTLVDWMERVAAQTGSRSFHFVDEAAPPKLLKELSLEILKRGLRFSWWTNIRFEASFTGDLCRLMSSAGCIAVSGGLEIANDRLLKLINKGVTIEQATIAMRNFYYCGIMVHAYLMYGFPTQTLQESVDSLEVVRQMFRAELISSAFWHRYAMTIHSPSGENPEEFGVRRKSKHINGFANNEVYYAEDRGYNINIVGDALRTATANYLQGELIDRAAHKWFECKAQPTTVENSEITDHLIKPDKSRIFDPTARLVWIGDEVVRTEKGIMVESNSESKELGFVDADADFLVELISRVAQLDLKITFAEAAELYKKYSEELFVVLYHSKKWDKLRTYGLLQVPSGR